MISFYKRLEKLTTLPLGWDGYQAGPVNRGNAFFASRIAEHLYRLIDETPQVVPCFDGDLQLEVHQSNASVEIHIKNPQEIIICVDYDDEIIYTETFKSSDKVIEWINMTWNHR